MRSSLSAGNHVSSHEGWWAGFSNTTRSGEVVTPETAMRVSAVHACVSLISATMATMPLKVYRRRKDGGKDEAPDHPLYSLLHDTPNDLLTSCEWREMQQAHLCLRGNSYAVITRNKAGEVVKITPLHPDRVSVFVKDGGAAYSVQEAEGGQTVLPQSSMLHLRGLGSDGVIGYSPIALARESIGLALATESHGATLFTNGARPGGVLETSAAMTPAQMEKFRQDWEKLHGGAGNTNKMAILPSGMKYNGVSLTQEEAQFLETRQFQVNDIARIFRVPPHMIGDLTKSSFSNIEHQGIEFVKHCIRPWAVRWEQRLDATLLTPLERREFFVAFNLDSLLRGDILSRYQAHRIGVDGGWLNVNEVRSTEDRNPIEGGDKFRVPMNMQLLDQLGQEIAPVTPAQNETSPNE